MSEPCGHYWQIIGIPGHRWVKSHALIRCKHCKVWSVGEYGIGTIGPCPHSIGQLLGAPHEVDMSPPKDWQPDPSYMECLDCQAIATATKYGEFVKLCPIHRECSGCDGDFMVGSHLPTCRGL